MRWRRFSVQEISSLQSSARFDSAGARQRHRPARTEALLPLLLAAASRALYESSQLPASAYRPASILAPLRSFGVQVFRLGSPGQALAESFPPFNRKLHSASTFSTNVFFWLGLPAAIAQRPCARPCRPPVLLGHAPSTPPCILISPCFPMLAEQA